MSTQDERGEMNRPGPRGPAVSWPWLMQPCPVRILVYSDFNLAFSSAGPFQGLGHVLDTLKSHSYFWVSFHPTLANRVDDPSAERKPVTLDQLDLSNQYDELWLFGSRETEPASQLQAAEVAAVKDFMSKGGGVLVTGDHANVGRALASAVPRAGKLRLWPGPPELDRQRLSSLRPGSPPGFQFEKQSDDVPQELRLRTYALSGSPWWKHATVPHPLMDGPGGPIDVFPDHMHEGEVVIPGDYPPDEWPSQGGYQPKPEVVAWGKVVQPGLARTGQEFGVVGAYDGHRAGAGRVVADSSFHHWFDINLVGDHGPPTRGFLTPNGQPVLRKIESYFLNVGRWLAPPNLQVSLRNRLFWGALWRDPLIMLPADVPAPVIGEAAFDALAKYVPRSTVVHWVWDLLPNELWSKLEPTLGRSHCPPMLEECLLGAALQTLLTRVRQAGSFHAQMSEEQVAATMNQAFGDAVRAGLDACRSLATEACRAVEQLA